MGLCGVEERELEGFPEAERAPPPCNLNRVASGRIDDAVADGRSTLWDAKPAGSGGASSAVPSHPNKSLGPLS